jgi:protein-L-isoaspartate O-methyltransferase
MTPDSQASPDIEQLLADFQRWLLDGHFQRGSLSKYRGSEPGLQRMNLRPVQIKGQPYLQIVFRHATRDVTKNHPAAQAAAALRPWLGPGAFRHAVLHHGTARAEWMVTERGQVHARTVSAAPAQAGPAPLRPAGGEPPPATDTAHNRAKHRYLSIDRPFLVELGVTTAEHALVPSMARKWKQINKFIEVFSHALKASTLASATHLEIVDFGCGKGYLTFAIHDWLRHTCGIDAVVTGVELRADLNALCNAVVDRLGLQGLHFAQGDVRHWQPRHLDVMIALHACDTATDHAIDLGVRGGAAIVLCSPCCHKQIRPQLLQPHPMRPVLRHGVHLGQEAEMLTDSLRALLLESRGYEAQVFEFVSLEHTNKNKMILGVRRPQAGNEAQALQEVAALMAYYGVQEHCLETLLSAPESGSVARPDVN